MHRRCKAGSEITLKPLIYVNARDSDAITLNLPDLLQFPTLYGRSPLRLSEHGCRQRPTLHIAHPIPQRLLKT
jgi:hypothetical protein